MPEDGQVFRDKSYDELKRERLKERDGREDGVKRRTG
jgi:IS5 family transposase